MGILIADNDIEYTRFCDACGRLLTTNSHDKYIRYYGVDLCNKHYKQMKKYGRLIDNNPRTIYDKNEYHIYDDVTMVDLYNKFGYIVAQAIIDTIDLNKIEDKKW